MAILYLLLLGTGMALDETYVNRRTVLAGALAVHSITSGGLWLPLSLYLDVGLIVGVYGLYAYVVDGYVPRWFRLLAFMLYSPLSILVVLIFPDVLFFLSLAIAGYANVQLLATLHPVEPYYFGPASPDNVSRAARQTGSPEPVERPDAEPGAGLIEVVSNSPTVGGDAAGHASGSEAEGSAAETSARRPAPEEGGNKPSDRDVLPGFMRRL